MYDLNEYVFHKIYGVLFVEGFETIELNNEKIKYYVLSMPFSQNETTRVKLPIDNCEMISSFPNKGELNTLIDKLKNIKSIWIPESKKRIKAYENIFYNADIPTIFSYLKALYEHKDVIKLTIKDQNFMRRAEQIIFSLISVGLNINYKDVKAYLLGETI